MKLIICKALPTSLQTTEQNLLMQGKQLCMMLATLNDPVHIRQSKKVYEPKFPKGGKQPITMFSEGFHFCLVLLSY